VITPTYDAGLLVFGARHVGGKILASKSCKKRPSFRQYFLISLIYESPILFDDAKSSFVFGTTAQ
jgi:hypothetical protein